jgi:coenzyme PQQ precursor peptide PqqA
MAGAIIVATAGADKAFYRLEMAPRGGAAPPPASLRATCAANLQPWSALLGHPFGTRVPPPMLRARAGRGLLARAPFRGTAWPCTALGAVPASLSTRSWRAQANRRRTAKRRRHPVPGALDWPGSVPHSASVCSICVTMQTEEAMKLEWELPEVTEEEVGLEVTSYLPAELDPA